MRTPLQWIPASAPLTRRGFASVSAVPTGERVWPAHDPRLAPRDEAIFLLHTAAEVEHALMVQYLYASWSAMLDQPAWAEVILGVAKQEMGHLITVENILRALRAPLNFDREDYPFRSGLYPFHFSLEPLSRASLARYVIAEMPKNPVGLPLDPPLSAADLEQIGHEATVANMEEMVNRVGDLYDHIRFIVEEGLQDADFSPSTIGFQAEPLPWRAAAVPGMIIQPIPSRAEALKALTAIAEQGEGMDQVSDPTSIKETHFFKFLKIYRERVLQGQSGPVREVPTNPSTTEPSLGPSAPEPGRGNEPDGHISHPLTRRLAQVFNLRYRTLLMSMAHALSLEADVKKDGEQTRPTGRQDLQAWSLAEMKWLSRFAEILIVLPQKKGADFGPPFGAPPFELPYTLDLPEAELDRWLLQQDLIENGRILISLIREENLNLPSNIADLLNSLEQKETGSDNPTAKEKIVATHIEMERPPGEGPITDIQELRIFPPLAIARFGSSDDPMDNYELRDPVGAGFRQISPAETLRVNKATGEITAAETPVQVRFRDAAGNIRPVCPFLELWARFHEAGSYQPLTVAHLRALGLTPADVKWRVRLANHKAFRRTGDINDRIDADSGSFNDHALKDLHGTAANFKVGKFISLGAVQFLAPNEQFPELRLRFTPSKGKVYGPQAGDPNVVDDVYNASAGRWPGHQDGAPGAPPFTNPAGIYASDENGLSRGYLDDSCDGTNVGRTTPQFSS